MNSLSETMGPKAEGVANFLKGLASPHRLMILCELAAGERCVAELIAATGVAPTSMSQHLATLKAQEIVTVRRDHRTLFYTIASPAVRDLMAVLYTHFCKEESE